MFRRLYGDSTWAKYSLIWSGLQALVIIALETAIFVLHLSEATEIKKATAQAQIKLGTSTTAGSPSADPSATLGDATMIVVQVARVLSVYHVLFIVAQVFQLALLCDAMYNKNTIQIIAIVAFDIAMLAYAGVQVKQASDILVRNPAQPIQGAILDVLESRSIPYHASLPYEIAVVVFMVIFALGFSWIAYKLYKEFGWTIYKKIGADLAMRDMYKVYQLFIMILKFDIFFWIGFSAQFLTVLAFRAADDPNNSGVDITSVLTLHLILSGTASVVMPFFAWWGLKRESKLAMSCFVIGGVATLAYNIIKLNQVFANEDHEFDGAIKFLCFFLILNLLLGIVTIYFAYVCLRNFNKGLNAHIGKVSGTNIYPMESMQKPSKRWSIE